MTVLKNKEVRHSIQHNSINQTTENTNYGITAPSTFVQEIGCESSTASKPTQSYFWTNCYLPWTFFILAKQRIL